MKIKLTASIPLLAVFAMTVGASNMDKLIQDLKDPSSSVREEAIMALDGLNDSRVVEPLAQLLNY